jgi:hypothetical protein
MFGLTRTLINEALNAFPFRCTRLFCKPLHDNEVRLQFCALAYNRGTFLRCIEPPEEIAEW